MATKPVPKPKLFSEVGSTGLNKTGGYISAEFLPQLRGLSGAKKYREMAENDPLLSGIIFMMTSLVKNVDWRFELPEDVRDSKEAMDRAKMVEKAILHDLENPFEEVVGEICTKFVYGFAPMEVVYYKHEKGAILPKSISLRSQETVERWEFDDEARNLVGMWQNDYEHPITFIPIGKLMLFTTTSERGNPEGRSVLRGAYTTWLRKKVIEEAEGRVALRAAGLVVVRIPGEILQRTDEVAQRLYAQYVAMANNLAQDRQGAAVLSSDVDPDTKQKLYDVEYVGTQGSQKTADLSPIIERLDKRMAGIVMADFILLGQQGVGSYALSSDKTTMFANALGSFLRTIAVTFNRQLIQRIWELNAWPEEEMPTMISGDIEARDLAAFGSFLANLASAGMPLFPDDELEDWIREEAGLPKKSDAAREQQEEAKAMEAEERAASLESEKAKALALAGKAAPPADGAKPPKPGKPAKPKAEA